MTKPQAVAEAEFRISDDLFTIGVFKVWGTCDRVERDQILHARSNYWGTKGL